MAASSLRPMRRMRISSLPARVSKTQPWPVRTSGIGRVQPLLSSRRATLSPSLTIRRPCAQASKKARRSSAESLSSGSSLSELMPRMARTSASSLRATLSTKASAATSGETNVLCVPAPAGTESASANSSAAAPFRNRLVIVRFFIIGPITVNCATARRPRLRHPPGARHWLAGRRRPGAEWPGWHCHGRSAAASGGRRWHHARRCRD